ncbi:hypothetical protein MNEG_10293, partial [Monoraphidium neglectum]
MASLFLSSILDAFVAPAGGPGLLNSGLDSPTRCARDSGCLGFSEEGGPLDSGCTC